MPNSDGLYSVDGDSEHDYADELSPSDGYFASGSSSNAIPNVPNVIVPDPTVRESETKAAEAKAREAAKESSFLDPRHTRGDLQPQALSARDISSYAQSAAPSTLSDSTRPLSTPPTSYAPSSNTASTRQPLRIHQAAGRTPSLYSEAPPAYTPSQPSQATPASPASPIAPLSPLLPTSQPNQTVNYGSISPSMGVESERLLGRDPESMGTPGDEEEAYRPRWSRRIRRKLPPWLNWKLSLLGIVLLMITIGFLSSGYKAVKGDNVSKSKLTQT